MSAAASCTAGRVVLGGRGQPRQRAPRPELELVRAAVADGVVAAGLVLTDAGPVGRAGAGGIRASAGSGAAPVPARPPEPPRLSRPLRFVLRLPPCGCSRLCRGRLLLLLRRDRLQIGDLAEVGLHLRGLHSVGVGHQCGGLLGLGVRHERVVRAHGMVHCGTLVLAARLVAGHPRRSGGATAEKREKIAGMAMTATAVPSAMRIRTAPPFVGRASARQALLGVGGLRPLHSRPERRAGRRRPFWLVAAGCAAGCVQPLDWSWVVSSIQCPGRLRAGASETSVSLNDPALALCFPVCSWNSAHSMHPKGRFGFAVRNLQDGTRTQVHRPVYRV